jgi:outer membrane protein assembly factor BamB
VVWTGDTLEDVLVDMRTKLFSLGSILSTPAVRDGVVYFGSVDGSVYALGL